MSSSQMTSGSHIELVARVGLEQTLLPACAAFHQADTSLLVPRQEHSLAGEAPAVIEPKFGFLLPVSLRAQQKN